MVALTDDNFSNVMSEIVEKAKSADDAIKAMTKLCYPNTKNNIKEVEAKAFYLKFKEINNIVNNKIKLDKNFTKNAHQERSKLYKEVYLKK